MRRFEYNLVLGRDIFINICAQIRKQDVVDEDFRIVNGVVVGVAVYYLLRDILCLHHLSFAVVVFGNLPAHLVAQGVAVGVCGFHCAQCGDVLLLFVFGDGARIVVLEAGEVVVQQCLLVAVAVVQPHQALINQERLVCCGIFVEFAVKFQFQEVVLRLQKVVVAEVKIVVEYFVSGDVFFKKFCQRPVCQEVVEGRHQVVFVVIRAKEYVLVVDGFAVFEGSGVLY